MGNPNGGVIPAQWAASWERIKRLCATQPSVLQIYAMDDTPDRLAILTPHGVHQIDGLLERCATYGETDAEIASSLTDLFAVLPPDVTLLRVVSRPVDLIACDAMRVLVATGVEPHIGYGWYLVWDMPMIIRFVQQHDVTALLGDGTFADLVARALQQTRDAAHSAWTSLEWQCVAIPGCDDAAWLGTLTDVTTSAAFWCPDVFRQTTFPSVARYLTILMPEDDSYLWIATVNPPNQAVSVVMLSYVIQQLAAPQSVGSAMRATMRAMLEPTTEPGKITIAGHTLPLPQTIVVPYA